MNTVLAIDPGTTHSAWLIYRDGTVLDFGHVANEGVIEMLRREAYEDTTVAIEMIASYGMSVGREVFETCVWIGRFAQVAIDANQGVEYVYRKDVKLHVCGTPRAKDANIRQALLDRFERTGGGKTPQIGTKAKPGPLYGISSHVWSALAVAVTYSDTKRGIGNCA
jgi:hypothetical protein